MRYPTPGRVVITGGSPSLRRKLGDPPVITTAPGVGYRIADQAGAGG